jgi:hypothetical protein
MAVAMHSIPPAASILTLLSALTLLSGLATLAVYRILVGVTVISVQCLSVNDYDAKVLLVAIIGMFVAVSGMK